jgi:uncharacterized protein (DUF58 family)
VNLPERHLRRLELTITRRLDGLLHGEHLGLLPGPGTELAEARLYQPGSDDVRHMDWPVTARTAIPHVRDLIADHELETWALVDLTASMDFGTTDHEKRDLAVAAVAAVGFLTARLGDRIGAWILNHGELRRVPARAGRAALYGLLRTLTEAPRTPATTGGPTLTDAITGLSRGRRGLRVIISDLLEPSAAWEKPLRALAARHQVLAIEIIDPRELDLPDVGVVHLADPETGAVREIMLDRRTRAAYAQAAAAQREDTRQALRGAGAAHLVLRTDRDWVADIARFALRQRRVAGRRAGIRT